MKKIFGLLKGGLITLVCISNPVNAVQTPEQIRVHAVPVTAEPLHIVRYNMSPFMIYTNQILPGIWTRYHQHGTDLLAVITEDTLVASQVPGEDSKTQKVPAGTVAFFPYADSPTAYVHRVGVTGEQPFVNVGLDFLAPLGNQCQATPAWQGPEIKAVASNRRGNAYHLQLENGASTALPAQGSGLLLVPLGPVDSTTGLQLDNLEWKPVQADFRFYNQAEQEKAPRPQRIKNTGSNTVSLVVFVAC